ncbi:MAG: methyltransferase domain-containing protein, partial [Rhodoferax sp.]
MNLDEISQKALIDAYLESLSVDVSKLLQADSEPIALLHCNDCDLKWYRPAPAGDPAFYEALQQHDWYYQDDKPEYSYAAKFVRVGMSVLEVGCGKGAFTKFLPKGASFRGLEFNEEAVKKGRSAALRIDIESVEDHAITHAGTYDAVCHFQVLEHVTDPSQFLNACTSLLKPGGILIVAVPSEDSFLSITEGGYLNMPPHHLTRWSD